MTAKTIAVSSHGRRAFLAGTGATGALVAAAALAFLSVAGFVAFSGALPFGGKGSGTQRVVLPPSAAAAAAAAAAAPATAAVAAAPAAPVAVAGAGPAGVPGTGGASTPPGGSLTTVAPDGGTTSPSGGSGQILTVPTTSPSGPGVTGGIVSDLDNTMGTNLSGPTSGVTSTVDETGRGLLNQVGGALGNNHLGDQATNAVTGITGRVLGGG